MVWFVEFSEIKVMIDFMVDVFVLSWDCGGKYFYFLVSMDVVFGLGWVNISVMGVFLEYGVYVIVLWEGDDSLFVFKSDEELVKKEKEGDKKEKSIEDKKVEFKKFIFKKKLGVVVDIVKIDWNNLVRRILVLFIFVNNYWFMMMGLKGFVFIGEWVENIFGIILKKFDLKSVKFNIFVGGVRNLVMSVDGKKMIVCMFRGLKIVDIVKFFGKGGIIICLRFCMKLDCMVEWV